MSSLADDLWQTLPADVVLQVPADPSSLRVVRMVTATLVADDGFDVDEVDDARMAVDELCAAVIESEPGSPIRVQFRVADHTLTVWIGADDPATAEAPPIDELRGAVLGAVTDDYHVELVEGRSFARFTKRSAAGSGHAPA